MSPWRLERRPIRRALARLTIGLDTQRAAWQVPGKLPGQSLARECPHVVLGAALPAGRLRRIDLVASPELALHWIQEAPRGVSGLAELRRVAQARCARLFGSEPASWQVSGDWRLDRPFVCAALPRATVQAIEDQLRPRATHLHWHSAWARLRAQRADRLPRDGWSVLRSPARLLLWHCRDGHVEHLASLPAAPHDSAEMLVERVLGQIRLETAALGLVPSATLHWCDPWRSGGEVPAHEAEAALALACGGNVS